jgi:uncharacterized protein (TIGR02646 family)
MKYIRKTAPPHLLIAWTRAKAEGKDSQNLQWGYADMQTEVRQAVKESLLHEQGWICCYTGRKISTASAHIEHLKPQSICIDHEDTDYSNLLAAYPAPNSPNQCEYGAHARKNWFDPSLFVHPLRADCEQRFRYKTNGKIEPVNLADKGAQETIRRLRLDHAALKQMREEAIAESIFARPLSKIQAQRLLATIEQRDGNGNFRAFCFVIKQACEKYLKRFEQ